MARLRRTNKVTVFTFEERTRLTNFFMLLVEIDARLPKSTKTKAKKRTTKAKDRSEDCYIKCPAMCCTSRPARRDLFLVPFTRIFKDNKINPMGYEIDRHHRFIAYT